MQKLKILAIGAHLDDIELGCGGTLAQAIEYGHDVKCVVVTQSDYTNYNGEVQRTVTQALQEGKNAFEILGVTDYQILDFPNKDVTVSSVLVETLNKIIDDYQPDIIFTHSPYCVHQDHRNVALATMSAGRRANTILFYEPFAPDRNYEVVDQPIYINIDFTITKKLRALQCHATEGQKYGDQWFLAMINRAQLYGFSIGCNYAERFTAYKMEFKLWETK